MIRHYRLLVFGLLVSGLLVTGLIAPSAALLSISSTKAPLPSHALTMSITGAVETDGSEASLAFRRIRAAGVSAMTFTINWPQVAPQQEPASWNPEDPNDPHYDWSSTDARIKAIVAAGFQPIVAATTAPAWARLATVTPYFTQSGPVPEKFIQFMRAAAERYSGKYPGVPLVRYWQIWNEPNIAVFFWPQFDASRNFTSPDVYRTMVNGAASAIHAVHADNIVIAGETAPFRDTIPEVYAVDKDWGPLKFMRRMLCVDDEGRPTCNESASFDVWSTHPYTSGGPTHHAVLPYDVSLGDLPEMRATLNAAVRAGHIKSARRVRFWVSEFSWDSNPPDRCAVPMSLLKRWVPESFYRMWANGVDLIGWFHLMDAPLDKSYFQSGLYLRATTLAAAKPKGYLAGFRFPFVALRRGARVYVWAHAPLGKPAIVTVQQTSRRGWKKVAKVRADSYGIAQALLMVKPVGQFRAVLTGGERSLPFSMRVPRDRFFNPFGQASTLEPNGKGCQT